MYTRETLLESLSALGIASRTFDHPPVHTVEEAKVVRGNMTGAHSKNLFLKDKKGRMYLLAALEDRKIDLKSLSARLSAKSLSFASADRLMTHLGVEPGSVTPFGAINDTENQVTVALDAELLEFDTVNFHPLVNTATTALHPRDLVRFLESCGHAPLILEM